MAIFCKRAARSADHIMFSLFVICLFAILVFSRFGFWLWLCISVPGLAYILPSW